MQTHASPVLVLMGPTASGKSALAIHLAQQMDGVILNADAMQCYDGLPILTAQPTAADRAAAPHALYGIWEPFSHGHAARWQKEAASHIAHTHAAGRLPILVGGTGMYVKLLSGGMAPVPPIAPEIRQRVRALSVAEAYTELEQHDARMALRLKPGDTQRIARALEVVLATGISLAEWQEHNAPPLIAPERFIYCHVTIPREVVYDRINRRFEQMIEQGALEEVEQMLSLLRAKRSNPAQSDVDSGLLRFARKSGDDGLPLLKAHGFPELSAYLRGQMPREEAVAKAQQHTRNYAKRQLTWIRHQLPDDALPIPHAWQSEQAEILSQLRKSIDRIA